MRRTAIVNWLQSRVAGKSVREHIAELLFVQRQVSKSRSALWKKLWREGLTVVNNLRLFYMITESRNDFPDPWAARPIRYVRNAKFSRVSFQPLSEKLKRAQEFAKRTGRDPMAWLNVVAGTQLLVRVEWEDHCVAEIVRDFERAIRREAAKHPGRKRRGNPAQSPFEPLKWLAAYRFKSAGFTFDEAQRLLKQHNNSGPARTATDYVVDLPTYADKSGWSDAIARAKRKLAELESPDPDVGWLLTAPY